MDTNKNQDINQEKQPQVVEVQPLTRGKRFLLYFCDLIICFFITFVLFNACAFPIGKYATDYNPRADESAELLNHNSDILYEHELLFYKEEKYTGFYQDSVYSFSYFMKYFIFETPELEKYDFVKNYYIDIKHDEEAYFNSYIVEDLDFFQREGDRVVLKQFYKDELIPMYDEKNELSSKGQDDLNFIQDRFYAANFAKMIDDIKENDLSIASGPTYNEASKIIETNDRYIRNVYIITTISAYLLAWAICFIIIPQSNRNHRTISMFMLHEDRINSHFIKLHKRHESLLYSLYALLENLAYIVFIPMVVVPFNIAISIMPLLILSLISLLFNIISLIWMMFDTYSRTLPDILTQTCVITEESLDDIYREIGYQF